MVGYKKKYLLMMLGFSQILFGSQIYDSLILLKVNITLLTQYI
ncbi:hypothetical protein glysoja_038944 [Glycine soja]|uniref:Uncharacterized protein n=1 Tax=Glycine soja TaxID=3848 RepID=A0A0B2SQ40_GLYSO|nr:hypothetical protein glysoja_038944 [Glycine soja]